MTILRASLFSNCDAKPIFSYTNVHECAQTLFARSVSVYAKKTFDSQKRVEKMQSFEFAEKLRQNVIQDKIKSEVAKKQLREIGFNTAYIDDEMHGGINIPKHKNNGQINSEKAQITQVTNDNNVTRENVVTSEYKRSASQTPFASLTTRYAFFVPKNTHRETYVGVDTNQFVFFTNTKNTIIENCFFAGIGILVWFYAKHVIRTFIDYIYFK